MWQNVFENIPPVEVSEISKKGSEVTEPAEFCICNLLNFVQLLKKKSLYSQVTEKD